MSQNSFGRHPSPNQRPISSDNGIQRSALMSTGYKLDSAQQAPKCAISFDPAGVSEPAGNHTRLLGLPCPKCGAYYFSGEPNCPICLRVSGSTGTSERLGKRVRLYGLPCPKCGAYYFTDEPSCPVCKTQRVSSTV